jgi:hypothetical protein
MSWEKTIFDYDAPGLELCKLEIRSNGENINGSNLIVKLYKPDKLNNLHRYIQGRKNSK